MAAANTIAYYDTATKSFPVEAKKKSFEEKKKEKKVDSVGTTKGEILSPVCHLFNPPRRQS